MRFTLAAACLVTCLHYNVVSARDIYVDNLVGNDEFDGLHSVVSDSRTGPVQSLRRAMHIARFGDQINLTRTGAIYYDSLSLTGSRHSGTPNYPFTLIGNGATLSGMRAVPPEGWRKAGTDVWKLTLTRKGFYRLLRDGVPLPESKPEDIENPLASLAAGEWVAWRGSLYFRSDAGAPSEQSFAYSADQTGVSLYQVDNVRIVDLTLRDFRFDGMRAQNMCSGITLENVTCINNGRAGLAISGSSQVAIIGGRYAENGRHQIQISAPAKAELREVAIDGEPTVLP